MSHQELLSEIAALPEVQKTIVCPVCGDVSHLSEVAIALGWGNESHETLDMMLNNNEHWECQECNTEYFCDSVPTIHNVIRNEGFDGGMCLATYLDNPLVRSELSAFLQEVEQSAEDSP